MGYYRVKRWLQDKVGIGENRDRLAQLELRVHALAALHQVHLPEVLLLPQEALDKVWTELPVGLQSASTAVHRSDPMLLYPLAVSGGDWGRCLQEYFQTGSETALWLREWAPDARSLVDFGGGFGRVGRFLPAAFPQASRWILDPKPAAVSFQQAQWGALPYAQEKVDLVFAGSVFTHLLPDAADVALRSIASSLAPNGLAVLTAHAAPTAGGDWVVHSRTEETALPELEDSLARTAYSSVSFSDDAWIKLLERNGFTDVHKKDVLFGGTQVIWAARKA